MLPGADQRRKAGDRPDGLAAARMALDRHADPHHRCRCRGVFTGELQDVLDRDTGLGRGEFRRVDLAPHGEFVEPQSVLVDVIAVREPFLDDDVHHRHRQGAVGAGLNRDVPVGQPRRTGADGIDDDELGTVPLGLLDERPMVRVGAERVAGPQDDVFGVDETLGVHARRMPDRHHVGGTGTRIAEGALTDGGAELVEEGIADVEAVDDALGAQIAVGKDRLGSALGDDGLPTARDLVQSLVPSDARELAASLRTDALHRVEHALVAINPVLVIVDLHAEAPFGEGMIRVAPDSDRLAVLHRREDRAGIGAIVRACADDDFASHIHSPVE